MSGGDMVGMAGHGTNTVKTTGLTPTIAQAPTGSRRGGGHRQGGLAGAVGGVCLDPIVWKPAVTQRALHHVPGRAALGEGWD